MESSKFKFRKVFSIWMAVLGIILFLVMFLGDSDSDLDFFVLVMSALFFVFIISWLMTLIQKWIFEARYAYGGIISQKLEDSGVKKVARNVNTSTRMTWSFLGDWKLVFFGIIAVYLNIKFASTIYFSSTSSEDYGWFFLMFGIPTILANLIFYYGFGRAKIRHELTRPINFVFLITTLTLIALIIVHIIPVDYEANKVRSVYEQYNFVEGELVGPNRQYEFGESGLLFTYPKEWSVAEATSRIIITPQEGDELLDVLKGGSTQFVGIDVRVSSTPPGKEFKEFLESMVARNPTGSRFQKNKNSKLPPGEEYKGMISIDGGTFPYFVFYKIGEEDFKEINYYFSNNVKTFSAECFLAPHRGVTEEQCGQIISAIQYK